MGDTGSQVIGLMLATIGIIYFWNNSSSMSDTISVSKQVIVVVTAFILPIADTTIVVMNRLASKRSPFIGGRDHTTHNLFFRGVTEKRIAILFGGIGFLSLIIIYYVQTQISEWGTIQFIFFALYPITIFLSLFAVTKIKKPIIYPSTLTKESKSSP
jgi:UDP-GlcNAc:undecaprenyl-phosphate GlcNAc-1-phosphate transferase